jgi:hypothetical protein
MEGGVYGQNYPAGKHRVSLGEGNSKGGFSESDYDGMILLEEMESLSEAWM